jgi:hypothetical protein
VRRFAAFLVVALASVGAVVALQSATMSRPDPVLPGSSSIVTFEVSTNGFPATADPGDALWESCQASMRSRTVAFASISPTAYEVTVAPALGKHSVRHLRGCLEDARLDRLQGTVTDVVAIDADGHLLDDDLDETETAADDDD